MLTREETADAADSDPLGGDDGGVGPVLRENAFL
jgi:hypothetical protein